MRPRGSQSTTSRSELEFVALIDPDLGPLREESIWIQLDCVRTVHPDLLFRRGQVTVFYDGCYWHECPEHHQNVWGGKVSAKDSAVNRRLADWGWLVVRVWEHEPLANAADRVNRLVKLHQTTYPERIVTQYYHQGINRRPPLPNLI